MGVVEAGCLADGGPHAKHGIHGAQIQTQGVAADITGKNSATRRFFYGKKTGAVRTAGAQRRATTAGKWYRQGMGFLANEFANDFLDMFGIEFPNGGDGI